MPNEYVAIQRVVTKLASHSNLGGNNLTFTIVPGSYAMKQAAQLGLCGEDDCDYFGQLNPFASHDRKTTEILRQSYLYGDAQAWAHSNGTIEITLQSFHLSKGRDSFLACTLAHEITHAIENHVYYQTQMTSRASQGSSEEEKKLIEAKASRHFEMLADRGAQDMLTRAGYPQDSCIKTLDDIYKTTGNGTITEERSTHPSLDDRIGALEEYISEIEKEKTLPSKTGTPGIWSYNPQMNYIRFSPSTPLDGEPSTPRQSSAQQPKLLESAKETR